jgi:hypothetical protein
VRGNIVVTMVLLLCLVLGSAALAGELKGGLTLVNNGQSDYLIVIPASPRADEKRAAEELRNFIKQISGAFLTIALDNSVPAAHEIILGANNRHLGYAGVKFDPAKWGKEGFTIRTKDQYLAIGGGPWKGTLYGVETFLETYLGCRWYSTKVSYIPSKPTITISAINDTQKPAMDGGYRFMYTWDAAWAGDVAFQDRLKYTNAVPDSNKDDGFMMGPGGLAHTTMLYYLKAEDYFKDHPEYFSLLDGKREPQELCLSNPDVYRIVSDNLRKYIKQYPNTKFFAFSQMDNAGWCRCDQCKAIDDREGGPTGSVINFINKLAREFPNVTISTLAYWYTTDPPKHLKLEPNVHITYCTPGYATLPFEKDMSDFSVQHRNNFDGWSKLTKNLFIWDYTNPGSPLDPYPSLHNIGPNMRYFIKGGAKGAFIEGLASPGSEFEELRGYMFLKYMWNPNIDDSALMDEFLNGYYGAAGPFIRQYIEAMHNSLLESGARLSNRDWVGDHRNDYLKPEMLAKYDGFFDAAEKAVASQPDVLLRVQKCRAPLVHAELLLGYGDIDKRIAQATWLLDICQRTGIKYNWDGFQDPIEGHMNWLMGELQKEKAAKK